MVNPFPASSKTPGQQASRAAYAALESKRAEYGWWEKYLDLREEGWDWRKAAYIAWLSSPPEVRWPKTLEALASEVLGINSTSTIRKWRAKQPEIAARVETLKVSMLNSMAMSAEDVLYLLSEQARANFGDFITVQEVEKDGVKEKTWRLDFDAIKRKGHLVKALKETQHGLSLVLVDSQNALITLARHHKLLTDKVEVDGWQNRLIRGLLDGELEPADIREELGDEVAEQLLIAAGLPRHAGREAADESGAT